MTTMPDTSMLIAAPKDIMMNTDLIAANLAVVDAHMRGEVADPASIMALYGEGIVLEILSRNLVFTRLSDIEANYRRMFGAMKILRMVPIDRFATLDRVVDECLVEIEITGSGLDGLPYPIGARLEIRLLHIFRMKAARIMRETVYETYTLLP
jgi:hypothetical protein